MIRALFTACLLLSFAAVAAEPGSGWRGVAAQVSDAVTQAERQAAGGDTSAGLDTLTDAYFGRFEESRMEIAVRQSISAQRAAEVEGMFGTLRKAMRAGDRAAVAGEAERLRRALTEDGARLDADGVKPEAK